MPAPCTLQGRDICGQSFKPASVLSGIVGMQLPSNAHQEVNAIFLSRACSPCIADLADGPFPVAESSNTDFLDWLRSTLAEALKASAQHESLKKVVRELRASIEGKFYLAAVQASFPLTRQGL